MDLSSCQKKGSREREKGREKVMLRVVGAIKQPHGEREGSFRRTKMLKAPGKVILATSQPCSITTPSPNCTDIVTSKARQALPARLDWPLSPPSPQPRPQVMQSAPGKVHLSVP